MAEAGEEKKEKKEEEAPAPKKGGFKGGFLKKKKLLLLIIAVVVIGGGAGAFIFLRGGSAPAADEAQDAKVEQTADAEEKSKSEHKGKGEHKGNGSDEDGAVSNVKLEPFIVNLVDNSGTRYLKLTLNLELASGGTVSKIERQEARIRDSVIVLLSSKSYAEIGTVEGKYQLRDEIVQRINQFIGGNGVKTAYFTEFVIQ